MTLRRFNNLLSVVVVLLGLYIIITPLMPNILFLFRNDSPEVVAPYAGELAKAVGSGTTSEPPKENRIVIPTIGLNEPILEGNYISVINNGGTWRRPQSATPNNVGNSVIVGHRFFGNSVSTFYHLDKLGLDEILAVYWEGKEILYKITDIKIVDATAVEVEAPSAERKLTIYTCHPLWTSKQRLVITAKPVEGDIEISNGGNS